MLHKREFTSDLQNHTLPGTNCATYFCRCVVQVWMNSNACDEYISLPINYRREDRRRFRPLAGLTTTERYTYRIRTRIKHNPIRLCSSIQFIQLKAALSYITPGQIIERFRLHLLQFLATLPHFRRFALTYLTLGEF